MTGNRDGTVRNPPPGKEWIGHALVGLPLAHVFGAALFLWAYGTGFGGGLTSLFSTTDIVTSSISSLPFVYTYAGVGVLFGAVYAEQLTRPQNKKPSKPPPHFEKRHPALAKYLEIMTWVGLPLALAIWYDKLSGYFGYTPHLGLIVLSLSIGIILPAMKTGLSLGLREQGLKYVAIAIGPLALFMAAGLEIGQFDRHAPFSAYASNWKCGDGAIIRKVGENYLVVAPNGARMIVNTDCGVKITIPRPKLKLALVSE